jgi:hypothetical protein
LSPFSSGRSASMCSAPLHFGGDQREFGGSVGSDLE